ncbi:MAG: DUF1989 domain-containing protein [Rhodospirillales bacterium]
MADRIVIPARKGKAAILKAGQRIRVINTHGEQVVDTWAFSRADLHEFMSMEHTRASLLRVRPRVGDRLYTNKRRPILTLLEDSSPGIHDTVIAACDRWRYMELGIKGFHDSCTDNLAAALKELGLAPPETPSPLNLWMNIPFGADGTLSFEPPVSKKGDYVLFRAEMDVVMAFSACPQDILPINGVGRAPTEAHFEIN